ncbi:MAG: hypothetical protein L0Z63_06110 [Actinobacteria bacterium]|nr:hypothetical protein [Actinomycetota bacterium]
MVGTLSGLAIVSTWLSVNIFPVITNDSLTYLRHSDNLSSFGFVHFGYRQFGYPMFIEAMETVAGLVGVEPLLFAVAVQRFLLLSAIVYLVWVLRWWATPVVVAAISGEIVAYTNLVLTEGLSAPLALILAGLIVHLTRPLSGEKESARRVRITLTLLISIVALLLLAIRFQFFVFGLCSLAGAVALHRTPLRRLGWWTFSIYALLGFAILALLSAENLDERGEFSPSSNGERSEYWAVWSTVFTLDPTRSVDPELVEFYDDGTPYTFLHRVDALDLPDPERAELYRQQTSRLLEAAGLDIWGSRATSVLHSLRMGRLDDIEGLIAAILASDVSTVNALIHSNQLARSEGYDRFADALNEGRMPEAVITAPLALRLPLPHAHSLSAWLLPASILVLAFGSLRPPTRLLSLSALGITLAHALMIGYVRADNFRFLVTVTMFCLATASAVLSGLFRSPTPRSGTSSSVLPD